MSEIAGAMLAADLGPYTLAVSVVFLVAVVFLVTKGRSFWARFRNVEVGIASIDKQVNQVKPGEPTLREVIRAVHSQVAELRGDVTQLRISAAAAAEHAREARKTATAAAESVRRTNVLLTEHIAEIEAERHPDK